MEGNPFLNLPAFSGQATDLNKISVVIHLGAGKAAHGTLAQLLKPLTDQIEDLQQRVEALENP